MASIQGILKDDPRFRIKPAQQAAAACSGALITTLFMTPLDVVKTRLQTQQKALLSNKCFLYCNGLMEHLCPCAPNNIALGNVTEHKPQLKGTIDAFFKIGRIEGIGVLWSGLGPTLISALPSTVIYFVAYEQFKFRLNELYAQNKAKPNDVNNSVPMPLIFPSIAGICSRSLAVSVVSPIELCRTKMQSQKMTYSEMRSAIRDMIKAQGVFVLWRGLKPTIYRDVPFSGIYWTCYETIKKHSKIAEPTFAFSFAAGAISGSIAAIITTPFDVVKTHQQIEFGEKVIFTEHPARDIPSKSSKERLIEIYRSHGLRGIFAGVGPRLAKVTPACAIMIASFEYWKSFWYKYNIKKHKAETKEITQMSFKS